MAREWLDDPIITGNEDKDPVFRKEMYATFRYMKITPDRVYDPKEREEYIKYLKAIQTSSPKRPTRGRGHGDQR